MTFWGKLGAGAGLVIVVLVAFWLFGTVEQWQYNDCIKVGHTPAYCNWRYSHW